MPGPGEEIGAHVQVDEYEDTEFNDALRARGIIPPKPPSRSPSPERPEASEVRQAQLKKATVGDLDEELEKLQNGGDDEEERKLMALRRQRLRDLAKESRRGKFGRVYPITRPDYNREVTEASKEQHDDAERKKGTGVVCFLYNDSLDTCRLLAGFLDSLAAKYPATKFVSIVGDKCIPNYPDRNLPTLIIYRDGELHRQIIGLRPEIGLDGMNTKCEDIELLLTAVGAIEHSRIPGAETYEDTNDGREAESDEEEGFGGNRAKTKPSIRNQQKDDDDDDLDWDM